MPIGDSPEGDHGNYGDHDLTRVHQRLDDVLSKLAELTGEVKQIGERCGPCVKLIQKHEAVIHGNGRSGLVRDVDRMKVGRVDTLSVKSVCTLIAAVGALAATIGAAMAAFAA